MGTDLSMDVQDAQRQTEAGAAAEELEHAPQRVSPEVQAHAEARADIAELASELPAAPPSKPDSRDPFDQNVDALLLKFGLGSTGDRGKDFRLVAERLAHEVQERFGVPWQVCLAQACLESGNGQALGEAGRKGFIIFGIKPGKGYKGESLESGTAEGAQSQIKTTAAFRAYGSIEEAFYAYGDFLKKGFSEAFEFKNTPDLFLAALQKDPDHRYAEDAEYLNKIRDFWKKSNIAVESSVTAVLAAAGSAPNSTQTEENSLWSNVKRFFKDTFGTVKNAISRFLESIGLKKAVDKVAQAAGDQLQEWRDKLQDPDAPCFSFPKEFPAGTLISAAVSDVVRVRGVHPVTHDARHHNGVDIAAPKGTPILATSNGTVIDSWYDLKKRVDKNTGKEVESGGGWVVKVRYEDGHIGQYMHLMEKGAEKGSQLAPGGLIGLVGSTGGSTGPHLHYETRDASNKVLDPRPYLGAGLQASADEKREQLGLT